MRGLRAMGGVCPEQARLRNDIAYMIRGFHAEKDGDSHK
jgi:hypothetical protein